MTNALLDPSPLPYGVPQWSKITPDIILPAARSAMANQKEVWESVATSSEPATVANTLDVLDRAEAELSRVLAPAYTLFSSIGGDELDAVQAQLGPELSAHANAFWLDRRIFDRIEAIDLDGASEEAIYLVEDLLRKFRLRGIDLPEDTQAKLKELDSVLSGKEIEFARRAVKAMSDNSLMLTDREALAGLSEDEKNSYQDGDGYVIPLLNFTNQPLQADLDNAETRRALLQTSMARGLGGHESSDTRQLVVDIARLRAEKAALLGRPHHAQVVAEAGMATDSQKIVDLLTSVAGPAIAAVEREAADLTELAGGELAAADWTYHEAKLRARVSVNDADLRPYLALSNVVTNGIFYAASRLYGISFEERPDIPGYLPSVRTWEVFDSDGQAIGLFQADFYTRVGKNGGAWMNPIVSQSHAAGTKPVIMNNCNFTDPGEGKECLLTWDQVETVFHEFGHALHGLLSDTTYEMTSGTSVPRDFVELPSQLNEMWMYHPDVLARYAVHYETGEPLPAELVSKLSASKTFGQGFATTEFVASALLDQAWHRLDTEQIPSAEEVEDFEAAALSGFGVAHELVPPRYRSTYFTHTFGGGYDAGYYSYMWAEVLVADIEQWFADNAIDGDGGFNPEAGKILREELLSRGSSRDPMASFIAVRGREPRAEALLERRGL